jgi:hypothetical protein
MMMENIRKLFKSILKIINILTVQSLIINTKIIDKLFFNNYSTMVKNIDSGAKTLHLIFSTYLLCDIVNSLINVCSQ